MQKSLTVFNSTTLADTNATYSTIVIRNSDGSVSAAGVDNTGYVSSPTRTVTTTASAIAADKTVFCDATAGAFAFTLPSVGSSAGLELEVIKVDSSGNAVTVTGAGSDAVNGSNTHALSAQYDSAALRCNGSAWFIV